MSFISLIKFGHLAQFWTLFQQLISLLENLGVQSLVLGGHFVFSFLILTPCVFKFSLHLGYLRLCFLILSHQCLIWILIIKMTLLERLLFSLHLLSIMICSFFVLLDLLYSYLQLLFLLLQHFNLFLQILNLHLGFESTLPLFLMILIFSVVWWRICDSAVSLIGDVGYSTWRELVELLCTSDVWLFTMTSAWSLSEVIYNFIISLQFMSKFISICSCQTSWWRFGEFMMLMVGSDLVAWSHTSVGSVSFVIVEDRRWQTRLIWLSHIWVILSGPASWLSDTIFFIIELSRWLRLVLIFMRCRVPPVLDVSKAWVCLHGFSLRRLHFLQVSV